MKLHKALKLRKKLVGDIARLKVQIQTKNSYSEGSLNAEKYNVNALYLQLQEKINQLTIIVLSEYPAQDERFIQATKIRSQIGLPKYK